MRAAKAKAAEFKAAFFQSNSFQSLSIRTQAEVPNWHARDTCTCAMVGYRSGGCLARAGL